jgi:hypothetical protein
MKTFAADIHSPVKSDKTILIFRILFGLFTLQTLLSFSNQIIQATQYENYLFYRGSGLLPHFVNSILMILMLWDLQTNKFLREVNIKRLKWVAGISLVTLFSPFDHVGSLFHFSYWQSAISQIAYIAYQLGMFLFWLGLAFLLPNAIRFQEEQQLIV